MIEALDRLRHRVPVWWWLAYDTCVGAVIVTGVRPGSAAFVLGLAVLAVAVVLDVTEYVVKRARSL